MNWWRQLTETGPDGFSMLDMIGMVARLYVVPAIPLVVVAVGMSFIAVVEPWLAVFTVLAGWPLQVRLVYAVIGEISTQAVVAVCVGAAAAWVVSAFVVGHLLGFLPAVVVMIVASPHAVWAVGELEDWKVAADEAAQFERDRQEYRRRAEAVSPGGPRRPPPYRPPRPE